MPSPLKIVATNTFNEVDTTTDKLLLPPNKARYMLNCNILSQGEGNVGIVTNHKGNKQIEFALPAGDNVCIGTATDEENNVFYFFIWNSGGLHTIYQYNALTKQVNRLIQNLTDTANINILNFSKEFLILHANIVNDNLLYWVDGLNQARKTNIKKMFDKSITGYGAIIEQSFIDAYKQTAPLPPTGVYFSDTDKPFNRLYGQLTKYAQRFVYDDGEKSVYSDWSSVILPTKEPYNGINTIPTNNNGINVTVNTGNRLVKRIEIIVQASSGELNEEGLLPWRLIATVDKKKLGLADYASYVYKFYNDGNYPVVDQLEVIQPYIYMPDAPLCQAVAKRALTYANGRQGFEVVDIDASVSVSYADLFIEDNVENEFNEPIFTVVLGEPDYVKNEFVTRYDGTTFKTLGGRFIVHTITVGNDVKEGNKFIFSTGNGLIKNQFNFTVIALISDNAITIANNIKAKLIATGRIFKETPEIAGVHDIYSNTTDGDGNITFSYIIATKDHDGGYMGATANPIPVEFDSLKDTGESVRNIKMGSTIKLGIEYEDFDGKKSLTYTTDALVVGIKPANDDGIKASTIRLQINHKAPIWAKYYQITRTTDLRYNDFIQILIQNVVEVPTTNTDNYLDLVIGSFYTYQKLHPNSNLNFAFEKGDRISLLKKQDGTYYDFFETEVLSYNETVTDRVGANLVTNGTTTITVESASVGNIGKFILVDGIERTIIDAPTATTYLLDTPIGEVTAKTYLYYDLIDRRGTLRIRKPAIDIDPNSIIEVYKPSSASPTDKTFWEFQKKFPIINAGTVDAYHGGNPQNQTASLPALVDISEGTVYVRSREMPLNNVVPGTQVQIVTVEDPSYSDFYPSLFNDNGRVNAEDNAQGVVEFGSRMWFSNNYIEDTEINGLGYFINTNREDYNDEYGDIMLTKFEENKIFTFKQLRTAYVPVDARITQDNSDLSMLVNTGKLLNPIQYLAWEGGIGNNPESWISDGTHQYFVSPNSGVVIRLGGNGEEPISKTYQVDNEVRQELIDAYNNGARIFGGFDRKNGVYLFSIDSYFQYIYSDGFNDNNWRVTIPPPDAVYEIVLNPDHGDVDFSDPTLWVYTPDTDYVGSDSFTYRAFYDGEWTEPTRVCLDIVENLNRQKGWRPIGPSCVMQGEYRTGYQEFSNLEEYYLDDLTATGVTKPNVNTDANYVSPIYNIIACEPDGFGNVYMSETFTKEGCPEGQVGEDVLYEVLANTHYAATQEEADALAEQDIEDNGQNFANDNGTCSVVGTVGNDEQAMYVRRNDCPEGQLGSLWLATAPADTFFDINKTLANEKALDELAGAYGQSQANAGGSCEVPDYFTLEVVIYNTYNNAKYSNTDSRAKSFELTTGGGYSTVVGMVFVSTTIIRDETVHTFNIPYVGASVNINGFRGFLQYAALSSAMGVTEKLKKNGSVIGNGSRSIPSGQPINTQYEIFISTAIDSNFATGDVLRVEHGTPAPSCDLSISFVSKTDESGAGLDDGSITITGSTTYVGGFVLSKDNGATFPFTGTSPFTFNSLAPGVYNIKARNADGTCTTGISAVTINAYSPPVCDLVLDFVSKTDESAAGANDGTITVTVSTSHVGGWKLSIDNGATYPYTGTSPYTFTGLAPDTYFIKAQNADGSCTTSIPDVEINTEELPVFPFRWVTSGQYCVLDVDSENTGDKAWTTLLKVVDGGVNDGQPLDVNNNLTSDSGLIQESKSNVDTDSDYVAPVYDTDACPVYYEINGCEGFNGCYTVAQDACDTPLPHELGACLYSDIRTDGIILIGDTLFFNDSENPGTKIPFVCPSGDMYLTYNELGGTKVWVELSETGVVLDKGVCVDNPCDLTLNILSVTNETVEGDGGGVSFEYTTTDLDTPCVKFNDFPCINLTDPNPQNFSGLSAGSYDIEIRQGLCRSEKLHFTILPVDVVSTCDPFLSITFEVSQGSTDETANINAIVTGGSGSYTYLWSNGQTTQAATGLAKSESHSVQVTDTVNGCYTTKSVIPNIEILKGLWIEVMYFTNNTSDSEDYFHDRMCVGSHYCNNAKYQVLGNGISLGTANMNNKGGSDDWVNKPIPPSPLPPSYASPNDSDRYWSKQITPSEAVDISDMSGNIKIKLQYIGSGTPHSSAIWIRIKDSKFGTILLSTCVSSFSEYTFNPYE